MTNPLYTEIIQALAKAEAVGEFREAHRGEYLSWREARHEYGTWAVKEYERQFGVPVRSGPASNSKKFYLVSRLKAIVEGNEIGRLVTGFEQKVRRHQRQLNGIYTK